MKLFEWNWISVIVWNFPCVSVIEVMQGCASNPEVAAMRNCARVNLEGATWRIMRDPAKSPVRGYITIALFRAGITSTVMADAVFSVMVESVSTRAGKQMCRKQENQPKNSKHYDVPRKWSALKWGVGDLWSNAAVRHTVFSSAVNLTWMWSRVYFGANVFSDLGCFNKHEARIKYCRLFRWLTKSVQSC